MSSKQDIKIVIVEDDIYYNMALTKYIHTVCNPRMYPGIDFRVESYSSGQECLDQLTKDTHILLLDYFLSGEDSTDAINGDAIIKRAKAYCPSCKIIMISAQQNVSVTDSLMKMGIYDYIDKTINSRDRVGAILQQLIKREFSDIN